MKIKSIYTTIEKTDYLEALYQKKYKIRTCSIDYLVSLIDKHGYNILRTTKNKIHTKYEKQEAINRVLLNSESAWSVAIDIGLLSY